MTIPRGIDFAATIKGTGFPPEARIICLIFIRIICFTNGGAVVGTVPVAFDICAMDVKDVARSIFTV